MDDKVELLVADEDDGAEDDDEDEWDAKSWDDVNLNNKGAFADEEVDSEPKPIVKEIKNAVPAQNAGEICILFIFWLVLVLPEIETS